MLSLLLAAAMSAFAQPTAIANPASVHCAKVGGKTEILDAKDGQVGYCRLADKGAIEEWGLLRGAHTAAAKAFLKGRPCAKAGGSLTVIGKAPKTLEVCTFPDKSSIDAASLAAGPKKRPELAKLLK